MREETIYQAAPAAEENLSAEMGAIEKEVRAVARKRLEREVRAAAELLRQFLVDPDGRCADCPGLGVGSAEVLEVLMGAAVEFRAPEREVDAVSDFVLRSRGVEMSAGSLGRAVFDRDLGNAGR